MQQQSQGQIQAGTRDIVESASARGVLRSTLPVDAQQALQASIGQALQQSLGQLGAEQAKEVGGIRSQIGELGLRRQSSIAELARALEGQDIERQRLELSRQQADREYQLQQAQLAIERTKASQGGRTPTQFEVTAQATSALASELSRVAGRDGYVSPKSFNAARQEWTRAGFSSDQFSQLFRGFANPRHYQDYGLKK